MPADDVVSQSALQHYVKSVCPEDYLEELLARVREYVDDDLPMYTDSLRAAFHDVEPVFTRKRYAEFFWHCATTVQGYMARVVLANGPAESEGSEKLFHLWRGVDYDPHAEERILQHAYDESRHSRIFVRLADLAFPGFLTEDGKAYLNETMPDVRKRPKIKEGDRIPENHLMDHLAQMNIGEIRTRLHMHLFAPLIYGFTPPENKPLVRKLLEALVKDEVRHIGYTALLMEGWARNGDASYIERLYRGRLHTFNRITVEQTESAVQQYGAGRFPDLLEI